MTAIQRFEDIKGWQKARELCNAVYELTKCGKFAQDFGLRDQIRRAAISIMSNIAEGFESQNNKTFIRYLYIAKASCAEVRAQLYVASDQNYISQKDFNILKQLTVETGKLIGVLSVIYRAIIKTPD